MNLDKGITYDTVRMATIRLRYDGKYDFGTGDTRQWTVMSAVPGYEYVDNRASRPSFMHESLIEKLKEWGVI